MEKWKQEIGPNNFSRLEASKESIETLDALRKYLDEGYLLHGSKTNSPVLEPRQAKDTDKGRVTGNQFGVYADKEVEAPIFMALKERAVAGKEAKSFYSGKDGQYKMGGVNIILTPGYIHVCPTDTFEVVRNEETGDEELVSPVSVRAVKILEVKPDILSLFPNIKIDLSTASSELSNE